MEDKIALLEKRIEELERQQSEHVKQSDIFPSTIKSRHLDENILDNLTFANQATGDILYASSASAFARLGIGAATEFLGVTAGIPDWKFAFSNYKLLSHTRDMTGASGNVTYTGYGFTPKVLFVFGSFTSSGSDAFTFGITDGTTTKCMSQDEGGDFSFTNDLIIAWDTYPDKNQGASLSSFNSDGYVLTWTITASAPSAGTFNFATLALG